MKLFVSVDIVGCSGTTLVAETHKGDAGICELASDLVPGIRTMPAKTGVRGSTINVPLETV